MAGIRSQLWLSSSGPTACCAPWDQIPRVQARAAEPAVLQVSEATGSPAAVLGLSRAELAVARLAASGLTSRQVASQLVSVKTVVYRLHNSYIKLDITARRALAALLH